LSQIQVPYVIPYETFRGQLITFRMDQYARRGAGMGNAEEFSGQRPGRTRVLPAYRRPGSRSGRIRYAHGGALPRVEPFCAVPQGAADHREGDGDVGGVEDATGVADCGDLGSGAWPMALPAAGRHSDVWVLVCGGIAAAAAFAAAFVASGGISSHPATPGATMPTVVSQACPSPAPGATP
jgi:hypothetical protein